MFFMCPSSSRKEVRAFVGITWSLDQSWDQSPQHLPAGPDSHPHPPSAPGPACGYPPRSFLCLNSLGSFHTGSFLAFSAHTGLTALHGCSSVPFIHQGVSRWFLIVVVVAASALSSTLVYT